VRAHHLYHRANDDLCQNFSHIYHKAIRNSIKANLIRWFLFINTAVYRICMSATSNQNDNNSKKVKVILPYSDWESFISVKATSTRSAEMQRKKTGFQQPSILPQNNDVDSWDLCSIPKQCHDRCYICTNWKLVSKVKNKNILDTRVAMLGCIFM